MEIGIIVSLALFFYQQRKSNSQQQTSDNVTEYLDKLRRMEYGDLVAEIRENSKAISDLIHSEFSALQKLSQEIEGQLEDNHQDLLEKLDRLKVELHLDVLSELPFHFRFPKGIELVGREDDLSALRKMEGDIVLSGQPGSGKTFLLYHFAGEVGGKFVVSSDPDRVVKALPLSCPDLLIVDDAADQEPLIRRLLHFRKESKLSFRIIAVCWPFEVDGLKEFMRVPESRCYSLSLLSGENIVDIVRSQIQKAGKSPNPILLREINEQAFGRPGLAIRLTELILEDGIDTLLDGRAHFEMISRAFRRLPEDDLRPILAGFSVGGKHGVNKKGVSKVLGIPEARIVNTLRHLATGGILHEVDSNRLATIPAGFRHILLKEVFFTGDAHDLEEHYWGIIDSPDSGIEWHESSLETLLGAIGMGARLKQGIHDILDLIESKVPCLNHDRLFQRAAYLGEDWSTAVMDRYPNSSDAWADPGLHYLPRKTIPRLLGSGKEKKVELIKSWINNALREKNDPVDRQRILLEETLRWGKTNPQSKSVWHAFRVALSLSYSVCESEPGNESSFTVTPFQVTIHNAHDIASFWSYIVDFAWQHPPTDWKYLQKALYEWLYPLCTGVTLNPKLRAFTEAKAVEVANELFKIPGVPQNGLAAWMIKTTRGKDLDLGNLRADPEFLVIYPIDTEKSSDDNGRRLVEAAEELGHSWAQKKPAEILERTRRFAAEQNKFKFPVLPFWGRVGRILARNVGYLAEWIEPSFAEPVPAEFFEALLLKAKEDTHACYVDWLSRALSVESYRYSAISLILPDDHLPESVFRDTLEYLNDYKKLIGALTLQGMIPLKWIRIIKDHSTPRILRRMAFTDLSSESQTILKADRNLWLSIFQKGMAAPLDLDDDEHLNFEKILIEFPEMAYELAEAILQPKKTFYSIGNCIEVAFQQVSRSLSQEERIRLLPFLKNLRMLDAIPAILIGEDSEVYKALLAKEELQFFHLAPLGGSPSTEAWQEKALIALGHGKSPREIACRFEVWTFRHLEEGPLEIYRTRIEEFDALIESENEQLQEIGRHGKEYWTARSLQEQAEDSLN